MAHFSTENDNNNMNMNGINGTNINWNNNISASSLGGIDTSNRTTKTIKALIDSEAKESTILDVNNIDIGDNEPCSSFFRCIMKFQHINYMDTVWLPCKS